MNEGVDPGDIVAVGSRSVVRALGSDRVIKIPRPTTPDSWIRAEATYAAAAGAVGAPVPRLVDVVRFNERTCSVYERVAGTQMWQHIVATPSAAESMGWLLARVHAVLFAVPPPSRSSTASRRTCRVAGASGRPWDGRSSGARRCT